MNNAIEIYMDHVIVLGTRIDRPARIARSSWMEYWERCSTVKAP